MPAPTDAQAAPRHAGRRELALFALAYLIYFGVRAVTEGRAPDALRNARRVIDLERVTGLDHERAVQAAVLGSAFLRDAANAVYIYGHWPVLIVSGVLLFRHRPRHYRVLRDACLLSGLVGLLIFALFPVAPPRLTDLPVVDTVTQGSPGYRQLLPPSLVNQYAAMPSFHAGWNLLVGIAVFRAGRNVLLRAFALLMPAAMAFATVATANHYVIDVVAGAAIVLVALWAAEKRERSRVVRPTLPAPHVGQDVRDRPPGRQRPREPALR